MASRTKKVITTTTTTTAHSGEKTPSRSGVTSPRRERGPSPARTTRCQEKEQLINLNDRLAAYIDKVRFLEGENSRLSVQVRKSEEVVNKEISNVKSLYENELQDARKLLDATSKEKTKLQLDLNKYKSAADDWETKCHRKERDLANAEKKILALEGQINELTGRLSDEENRRKHYEKECNNLKLELAKANKALDESKKQCEEETLSRVDLENRMQTMKEDYDFKNTVMEQTLNETRTKTTYERDELEGRIATDYEQKLHDALQDIRNDHEEQMKQVRMELEELYEPRVRDLQNKLQRYSDDSSSYRDEVVKTKKRSDEMSSELTKLRALVADFEAKIRDLENQLSREQEAFRLRLDRKDEEINELNLALEEQTKEYSDLLDIKIRLDREIDAYRKLLEGEETRLNISQSSPSTSTIKKTTSSTVKSTPGNRKRKRTELTESTGYVTNSSSSTNVYITDVDTESGKFINISNKSEKDIPIGGYTIRHKAGDQETTYKFHRSIVLRGGSTISVWSSDGGQTHTPPTDLVMKGQKWFLSDDMGTALHNNSGDSIATREMKRKTLHTEYTEMLSDVDSGNEEEDGKERCAIM